jgi:hypothetical protein
MANKVERVVTEADIIDCPVTYFGKHIILSPTGR